MWRNKCQTSKTSNSLKTYFLSYDGTSNVSYATLPSSTGFSVFFTANWSPASTSINFPGSGTFTDIVNGQTIGVNNPMINLGTGIIIIPAAGVYSFAATITWSNSLSTAAAPDLNTISLYNITASEILVTNNYYTTSGSNPSTLHFNVPGINLSSAAHLQFQFTYSLGGGTRTIYGGPQSNISCQRIS